MAARRGVKRVNLALQGGGSHGAFAWGVLDSFLADGRLEIEGISGTSAGSVNAVVYAHGRVTGGVEGARAALAAFWKRLSGAGAGAGQAHAFHAFMRMAGAGSPYQWNPFNWNPFRQALEETVDFERLRASRITKLFLAATNVETGKARIFTTAEVSADVAEYFSTSAERQQPWLSGRLFESRIRRNIRLAEAPSFEQSIFKYAPTSAGADDYRALADEVLAMYGLRASPLASAA